MSKGHLEAMQALKAMRGKPLTRTVETKTTSFKQILPLIDVSTLETVTQTVTRPAKGGRGKKVHTSTADKQKAYRARKKVKA